jgi:hypothetical protein
LPADSGAGAPIGGDGGASARHLLSSVPTLAESIATRAGAVRRWSPASGDGIAQEHPSTARTSAEARGVLTEQEGKRGSVRRAPVPDAPQQDNVSVKLAVDRQSHRARRRLERFHVHTRTIIEQARQHHGRLAVDFRQRAARDVGKPERRISVFKIDPVSCLHIL